MKQILTVEFRGKAGELEFEEESVPVRSPEELFAFIAPGGGCDRIPDEVDEIQVVFLAPEHPNTQNPIADAPATLQLGMVFITGPLSEVALVAEQIVDKAGRGELSDSFRMVIGAGR